MLHDLRDALRALRRSPAFTASTVLTLALGIAATLTVFSVASALLLTPPAGVADPGRLLIVRGEPHDLSYRDVRALRDSRGAFEAVAAGKPWVVDVRVGDDTRLAAGAMVSSDYFAVLGVRPARGRFFQPDEETGSGSAVVVVGDAFWRRRLGADPAAVGRQIRVNGHSFSVIGVAPADFHGSRHAIAEELWVPLAMHNEFAPGVLASLDDTDWGWLTAIARLAPGTRPATAVSQAGTVAARLHPAGDEERFVASALLADAYVTPYLELLGALAAAGLLVACANVAGLEIARATARRRESAIRTALGASRAKLLRVAVAEGLLISVAASSVALVATAWASAALAAWLRSHDPTISEWLSFAPGRHVWSAAVLVAALTTVLFALAPALRRECRDLGPALRSSGDAPTLRGRRLLLVGQAVVSLVLVAGSGALAHTLHSALTAPLATDPETVLQVALQPAREGYNPSRALALYDELARRVAAIPGVRSVSFARNKLPRDRSFFEERAVVAVAGGRDTIPVSYDVVLPGYFRTVGPPLIAGREFTAGDAGSAPLAAIVNATFARRAWPGENPVGRHVQIAGEREVIGVAPDRPVPDGTHPFVYLSYAQDNPWPSSGMHLLARTAGPAARVSEGVRRAAAALDPSLPRPEARTLDQALRDEMSAQTLAATMAVAAGAFALLLSALGIYGMVAYLVSLRSRELAVRKALGASAGRLHRQVLADGAAVASWGAVIGVPIAAALTPPALRVLYGATAGVDVGGLAAAAAILVLAGTAACLAPAWRAARVDPMTAMRSE